MTWPWVVLILGGLTLLLALVRHVTKPGYTIRVERVTQQPREEVVEVITNAPAWATAFQVGQRIERAGNAILQRVGWLNEQNAKETEHVRAAQIEKRKTKFWRG